LQAIDTSSIERLIRRARVRIRTQWALEGATTASILASALALATIFGLRVEALGHTAGIALLVASGALVVLGATLGAARRLDDETVAGRIDRASGLSDRLSTAIAFRRALAQSPRGAESSAAKAEDDETTELMIAAIKDGVRAAPRADVIAATPFRRPRDLRPALAFLVISALAAGLAIPRPDTTPRVFHAVPDHGRPGDVVQLHGQNLLTGVSPSVASLPVHQVLGVPGPTTARSVVPSGVAVRLGVGAGETGRAVELLDWTKTAITLRIPEDAPIGPTTLTALIGPREVGTVPFTVVALDDPEYHKEGTVQLDPDERAYIQSLIEQIKALAQREQVPELEEFANKLEQLLEDAEQGKITKEQLLDALAKAEESLAQNAEPHQAEIQQAMAEMGKELAKEQLTKELGEALQKNDLQKAQQELEKLADRLDPEELQKKMEELEKKLQDPTLSEKDKQELQKKLDDLQKQQPLTEKQKEQLQKKLEQVAKQMEKKQQDQKQKHEQAQQKLQDEIKRLEKKQQEAKNDQERLSAERQLQKKRDELQRLQKEQEERDQSAQREALKRLHKDLEKAAENLDKPQKDPNKSPEEQDAEQRERQRQASQSLKDAARETGRVDRDQRKQAAQKKLSSQMDDLREAMRRAKQRSNKGPQDPFNKGGKNRDFAQRARGKKGSSQAWKPGQSGQQSGQDPNGGQGGQGGQNGKGWGTGTDDNLVGDPTQKSGNTKDTDLQGVHGSKGTSRRETILAAAQKGFASASYQKVYAEYQRIVEEVMRTEKLPSSYKYYVKRYFAKIHPSTAQGTSEPATEPAPPASQDSP
jgi:hypothetical protein